MKQQFFKIFQNSLLVIFISSVVLSCEKSTNSNEEKCNFISQKFNAKLKKSFCAYSIVEIVDSLHFSYGMNWTDKEGIEYKNVFAVKNYCEFNKYQIRENETFVCQLVRDAPSNNCITCEGVLYTPPLNHHVKVIR